ncbi:DASH complex, subunit Spc34 [Suhomyces tanzawaensis NRRL Y-17324]|uniref:DASH complex subunit SPC34 n=1 Tax=Suhomyces tanzawaensis NRRL Y-17324 TaxID=984487 RepID=A0A1E4SCL1_9ASCO|nr:DASH complex, subunit Spc34 [Suhomyces tanzawaensis NRRL Y-17324]ODV77235.1 DASH complex, subunit Spc34 [Suhomyces tanzawaensis NRRL Y-17324]
MSSLNYFLDRTEQSIESIQSLRFHPPGLFTNAIVKRPSITTLLKDPSVDEGALYKITKPRNQTRTAIKGSTRYESSNRINMEIRPERADGKSIYVDQSFQEYIQYKGDQGDQESLESKSVVKLPQLAHSSSTSPRRRKSMTTLLFSAETKDVGQICSQILTVIQKYPNLIEDRDAIVDKVMQSQNEYSLLANQCAQLESEIDDQKRQLTILNINYSDIGSPIKSSGQDKVYDDEEELDIEEYIRQEEEEIRLLEQQLDSMQGN